MLHLRSSKVDIYVLFYCKGWCMYRDKEFIGKKIRQYRILRKMSQAELSEIIGMSDKHLGRLEAGKSVPTCINFLNIICALDMDIRDFGINTKSSDNEHRDELIKMIYSMSDEEIERSLKILKVLQED